MKSFLQGIALGLLLLSPLSAQAQTPTVTAISDVSLNAGTTRTIPVVAYSAGTAITLTANLPAFAILNGPTTGTGVVSTNISLAPNAANVGTYNASVTATSGSSSTTENFVITVNAAGSNQAPIVTAPAVQNATVGTTLSFTVSATDSEPITSFSAISLPTGASFTPNGTNTSGTFTWTPTAGQTGNTDVTFTASNSMSGSATTHIHVSGICVNAPVLTAPASRTVNEGQALAFTVTATDADNDHVTLTTGALPPGATAVDQGNGSLNFNWTPNTSQSGTYTVTFYGNDGACNQVSATTTITVNNVTGTCVNAPVLNAPATRTVDEGQNLNFTVTATDADNDHVTLTNGSLPTGATAVDNGNNTLTFNWTPGNNQAGTYTVNFFGNDGACNQVSATTTITVNNTSGTCVNPPVLSAPATRTVTEGQTVSFTVTATDADNDHVTLGSGSLPSGANTTDNGNNTLTFTWTPNSNQAGTYTVNFFGNDGSCNEVSASTTITVLDNGGGGGGNGQATVTLIGQINTHNDRTCFRITPVNNSINLHDVDLTSFTLQFNGTTLHAIAGRVNLQTDCEDDDHDDGDCDNDAARLNLGGGHPRGHGDGDDDDDDDCDQCNNDDDDDDNCDAVGIRACFSTRELLDLFGDSIRDDLGNATIHFLVNGTEIVATFNGPVVIHGKNGHSLHAMAKPNPLNPQTKLSFTLTQPGRVQVSVYDMQGRLVNRILDRNLTVGPQTVVWDGSNSRNARVSSGVYFFRIQAPEGQEVKRVAVVK